MTVGTKEQMMKTPLVCQDKEYARRVVGGLMTERYRLKPYSAAGMGANISSLENLSRMDVLVDAERIMIGVGKRFGLTQEQLISKSRKREIVTARQMGFYIIKNRYDGRISLSSIGSLYGGRDHATVLHGIKTVNDLIETSKTYNKTLDELISTLT